MVNFIDRKTKKGRKAEKGTDLFSIRSSAVQVILAIALSLG
jgi:hypothetical protein